MSWFLNPWQHTGDGGCMVGPMTRGEPFPCDDDFRHTRTGKLINVTTSTDAHFSPALTEFQSLSELQSFEGVGEVRRMNPETYSECEALAHQVVSLLAAAAGLEHDEVYPDAREAVRRMAIDTERELIEETREAIEILHAALPHAEAMLAHHWHRQMNPLDPRERAALYAWVGDLVGATMGLMVGTVLGAALPQAAGVLTVLFAWGGGVAGSGVGAGMTPGFAGARRRRLQRYASIGGLVFPPLGIGSALGGYVGARAPDASANPSVMVGQRVETADGRVGTVEHTVRSHVWLRTDTGHLLGLHQDEIARVLQPRSLQGNPGASWRSRSLVPDFSFNPSVPTKGRSPKPKKGRKKKRRNPEGRTETVVVAAVRPDGAEEHAIDLERAGEHLVIHPTMRTLEEVRAAGRGRPHSWQVTHVPTGQAVAVVRTRDWARKLAKEIEAFSGPGIGSRDLETVQVAVGGPGLKRALYIAHVARQSWESPDERGRFPTFKKWKKTGHELNPDEEEDEFDRKLKVAVAAGVGAIVGGLGGAVVGLIIGSGVGWAVGTALAGGFMASTALGGVMFGGTFGVPIGALVGTIWGAVALTGRAMEGHENAGPAKLGAGVGAAFFTPVGAAVGGYLGA